MAGTRNPPPSTAPAAYMDHTTTRLVDFTSRLRFEDLPPAAVTAAKARILSGAVRDILSAVQRLEELKSVDAIIGLTRM